jgi:hypothetical protein
MIARCANPECTNEFRYLHQGKLYVLHSRNHSSPRFVWVCNSCARIMAPVSAEDGAVVNAAPRREAVRPEV